MILPPSKKIFIGSSAVISGVVLQFILGYLYSLSVAAIQSGKAANGAAPAEIERKLEALQEQMGLGLNGITASWFFMFFGVLMLLIGAWQNARATEALEARLAALNPPV